MEGSVEVPSFFLCPISLQIMRDPVTLSTGITYDRHNIERWIFTDKHDTCPLTKQPLGLPSDVCDNLITPNHTLRRLIQAWCTVNASQGIERFPTPRPPVDRAHVLDLIEEATSSPKRDALLRSLQRLKEIVGESERNRKCVESSGAVDFLFSVVENETMRDDYSSCSVLVLDEALNILHSLKISEEVLIQALDSRRHDFVETLTSILKGSSYQSRAYSTLLLKSIVLVVSAEKLIMGLRDDFFVEIVRVLEDKISYQAMKAALHILCKVTPWGRNKLRAVEAHAVHVIIGLLVDETERKGTEMKLIVLSQLSECAEGRAKIVGHAAGIAVVSKKLVRVSAGASEMAVRILHNIAKFLPMTGVLKEMMEVGAVPKLCLLIQVEVGPKTKEKAQEMLKMHARVWKSSPCISPQLQASYPC